MSLIRQSQEPPGMNCALGGLKVEAGIDTNGNAELEDDEATSIAYLS